MFLSLPSQNVPTSTYLYPSIKTPDSFQAWLFFTVFFYHSRVSSTCLMYFALIYFLDIFFDIFLAKSIFYTIKFMAMFLKVLNKVQFRATTQTLIVSFIIIDFLLFAKPLELVAINNSSSERRIIFVPRSLKFSMFWLFYITCMGAHFFAVELYNAIRFSTLSRMSRFLWHSSKWSRCFGRFVQYTSGLEILACSFDTDHNYVTTMLQLRPFINH